jgi:hypothetical protein
MMAAAAMVAAVGAGPLAFAKNGKPTPSGNMNLRLQGYEKISGEQVNILGIGQEIVDTGGSFLGDETFTYVDPASLGTGVCDGTISAGAIAFQGGGFGTDGQGQFNITMTFTPKGGTGGTACDTTVTTLLCNRTLVHKNLVSDLNAGQYHCVATNVTVGGTGVPASMEGHLDIVSGSNGPTD